MEILKTRNLTFPMICIAHSTHLGQKSRLRWTTTAYVPLNNKQ